MLDLAIDDRVFINNTIDAALQEVDMILNTENTELIGYPQYGTEFESFLWTLTPTTTEIEKYIKDKLSGDVYFLSGLSVDVHCQFITGEYRSIYYVQISVTDNQGNVGTRTYQYQ